MTYFVLTVLLGATPLLAHDGPDPLARWRCDDRSVSTQQSTLKSRLGPDGKILGKYRVIEDQQTSCLFLQGGQCGIELAKNYADATKFLPSEAMTVSAWVSIDRPLQWGGLLGVVQDNGVATQHRCHSLYR